MTGGPAPPLLSPRTARSGEPGSRAAAPRRRPGPRPACPGRPAPAAGPNYLFGIDPGIVSELAPIAAVIATFPAVSGAGSGIRIVSEWNIWPGIALPTFFPVLPTTHGVVKPLHEDPGPVDSPPADRAPDGMRTARERHA